MERKEEEETSSKEGKRERGEGKGGRDEESSWRSFTLELFDLT